MKKFFLTVAGLAAFGAATSAVAADLPARTYTKAPPMIAAIYDWSGFYIGANGGGGTSRNCWDINNSFGAVQAPAVREGCHDATGAMAGGQIGYRWQSASLGVRHRSAGRLGQSQGIEHQPVFPAARPGQPDQDRRASASSPARSAMPGATCSVREGRRGRDRQQL